MLIFSLVPSHAEAKTSYSAYKKVVQKLEKKHGKMSYVSDFEYSDGLTGCKLGGVAYIDLIDMNGDNKKELLVYYENGKEQMWKDYTYEVYTMKGKKAVKAGKGSTQFNSQTPYTSLATKEIDDKTYLLANVPDGDVNDLTYYTINDYKLKKAVSFRITGLIPEGSGIKRIVNGKEVEDEEYKKYSEKWNGGEETKVYNLNSSGSAFLTATINKTNETRKKLGLKTIDLSDDIAKTAWKEEYRDFVTSHSGYSFALIDIDGDEIPELYADSNQTAAGAIICSYGSGSLETLDVASLGLKYISGVGYFYVGSGRQGSYADTVYQLSNGKFTLIGEGYRIQDPTVRNASMEYSWEGTSMSESEYYAQIDQYISASSSGYASSNMVSSSEILSQLN